MIDVISAGRLEIGLIKASPFELAMSNQNPASITDRYWEAHALIPKAMNHPDGPFSWQGDYFQYRNVNVWPRCYQQPLPPLWNSAAGTSTARITARLGYKLGTPANGSGAKAVFGAYRDEYLKAHGRSAPRDRLGFLALVMVGDSVAKAEALAEKAKVFLKYAERGVEGFSNPAGYESVETNVRALLAARKGKVAMALPPCRRRRCRRIRRSNSSHCPGGFFGTPDMVFDQIRRSTTASAASITCHARPCRI